MVDRMGHKERGQAMILTAVALLGLILFVLYLIVNALSWFNAVSATKQALSRSAQDGAMQFMPDTDLGLTEIDDFENPSLPLSAGRHCLDPVKARQATLTALEYNLDWATSLYVKNDGSSLSPTDVTSDIAGVYLIELSVVNPPSLNCPETDPDPVYPAGNTYDFSVPYVHLAVRLPMKALFGTFTVDPVYTVDVTSAINPKGGSN